ncbi:hypothetical protein T492DRAFT_861317 [Pavlovales sp. CCMP2436]|nr:hypothetical protein T492DRAFT_861317 [Pavlovales sp. CCMP2436]
MRAATCGLLLVRHGFPIDVAEAATCGLLLVFKELEGLAAPPPATGRGVGGIPYFEELEGLTAQPPATGRGPTAAPVRRQSKAPRGRSLSFVLHLRPASRPLLAFRDAR